jgi:4-hydroxy-3-methylbut-2-enyl diphosphate reductase
VSPAVRATAAARDLQVIDATCPLVSKVHQEVRRFTGRGSTVLLIGHHDHEEVVGTRGEAPDQVVVVADPEEAARVQVPDPGRLAYVMQTTLAVDEAVETVSVLRERFPEIRGPHNDDICYATTNRQRAVRRVAEQADLVLVLGSQNSSNSQRLAEVSEAAGTPARLIDDASDVELAWLAGVRRIGITAGASAPPVLVDELVAALSGLGPTVVRQAGDLAEDVSFSLPKEVTTG